MQVNGGPAMLRPKAVVIMGGLAMPDVPVHKEQVRDLIKKHGSVKVIGVCFMGMFEKAGWPDTVPFDMVIDATIDPVSTETVETGPTISCGEDPTKAYTPNANGSA